MSDLSTEIDDLDLVAFRAALLVFAFGPLVPGGLVGATLEPWPGGPSDGRLASVSVPNGDGRTVLCNVGGWYDGLELFVAQVERAILALQATHPAAVAALVMCEFGGGEPISPLDTLRRRAGVEVDRNATLAATAFREQWRKTR